MAHGWRRRVKWALGMVLLSLALCMGIGAGQVPGNVPSGIRRRMEAPPEDIAAVNASLSANYRMADFSLDVREQVDFLLTPALLVQEAVSDNVVLTYPEE